MLYSGFLTGVGLLTDKAFCTIVENLSRDVKLK